MIDIYQYRQTLNLFQNSLTHLGNTTMFNDKIKLYKNLNTPINFKIRNRDRVLQTPSQVVLTIMDSNKVKLLQTYLDLNEIGKYYTITITGELLAPFEPARDYIFMLSVVEDDGAHSPLYIDHDFNVHGILWIEESSATIKTDTYTGFEEVKKLSLEGVNFLGVRTEGNTFNQLLDLNSLNHNHLYRMTETFDVKDIPIEFGTDIKHTVNHNMTIYVLKHKRRHFPIDTTKLGHWDIVKIYNDIDSNTLLDIDKESGHYLICVGTNEETIDMDIYQKYVK